MDPCKTPTYATPRTKMKTNHTKRCGKKQGRYVGRLVGNCSEQKRGGGPWRRAVRVCAVYTLVFALGWASVSTLRGLGVARRRGFGVDLGGRAFDALQRRRDDGCLGLNLHPLLDIGIPLVSVVRDEVCQRDATSREERKGRRVKRIIGERFATYPSHSVTTRHLVPYSSVRAFSKL